MENFWDQRYSSEEYAYGTEPNAFFKKEIQKLKPGKILLPAEGEGRNAVYAALLGWEVTAYDISIEGKKKAEKLAELKGVKINYILASHQDFFSEENCFDCIFLVYAHLGPEYRQAVHHRLVSFLKPGGHFIIEAFSKKQIENNSGGPRNIQMLFSEGELAEDFKKLKKVVIWEEEGNFEEGPFHRGKAAFIRMKGVK